MSGIRVPLKPGTGQAEDEADVSLARMIRARSWSERVQVPKPQTQHVGHGGWRFDDPAEEGVFAGRLLHAHPCRYWFVCRELQERCCPGVELRVVGDVELDVFAETGGDAGRGHCGGGEPDQGLWFRG